MSKLFIVYIIQCSDDTYYIGYTTDIQNRIKAHNNGKAAKYTRSRTPVKLVYEEHFKTKSEALKREHALKKLRRQQKEELITKFKKLKS